MEILPRQPKVECSKRFSKLLPAARSDNRDDVITLAANQSDRHLRDAGTMGFCNRRNRLDEREIPLQVFTLKPRQCGPIVVGTPASLRPVATDETHATIHRRR